MPRLEASLKGMVMSYGKSKKGARWKLIVGIALTCVASAASASAIVAGGSTLPVVGYTGQVSLGSALVTPTGNSLFGVYIANHAGSSLTYCPTGSGAGKKILAGGLAGNGVNDACPAGFGGMDPTQLQADFAGSDAPMSAKEYNAYLGSPIHGDGFSVSGSRPTQLPALAGAIGIVFKKKGVNALTLTEDQICGIFSGQITDWASLVPGISGPINVVYRSDSSGTSFSFLNHLSVVCPSVPSAATDFKTVQDFAAGASTYFSWYVSSSGARSNAAVVNLVSGTSPGTFPGAPTDGSIGYAEVANTIRQAVGVASVTNLAGKTVNPVFGFGTQALPVTLVYDKVIADIVDTVGRPVLIDLPLTNGNPTTSNGCIAVVDPFSYANLAPSGSGSAAYPIISITYLLGNTQENGAHAAVVRGFLGTPYDTTIRPSVTTIGRAGMGYSWLSNADLTQARVDSCIN